MTTPRERALLDAPVKLAQAEARVAELEAALRDICRYHDGEVDRAALLRALETADRLLDREASR